jgi:C-terminal processing protease CtpA/Prc
MSADISKNQSEYNRNLTQKSNVSSSTATPDSILYTYNPNKIQCDSSVQTETRVRDTPTQPKNEFIKRKIIVIRENNEKFGFILRGEKPVVVETIDKDSPCKFANIFPNDVIISVDGIDVEDKSHRFLVELLKTSGKRTVFEVNVSKRDFI